MTNEVRRVLIKMSGEAIADETGEAVVDYERLSEFASQIRLARGADESLQICIVVGGGNIARGKSLSSFGRTRADHMGMLATLINGLALQDVLEKQAVDTRVLTGLDARSVAESYIYGRALKHLAKNRVVVFAGGIGQTYFSTDTTAAQRASELEVDQLLLAKNNVQGVFTSDPLKNADARLYKSMQYDELLVKNLEVMDGTAVAICKDQSIPIYVFDMFASDTAVLESLNGNHHESDLGGTLISDRQGSEFRNKRTHR